nr:ADP-ribosylation factor-binding protein GGA3 [Leptinotarsa decemlineata]
MDMITQTSLEALLLKATNSKNLNFDTAAVEAFCTLVNKERDGAYIGVKVIAARLTAEEKEVLQTLNVLDTCMTKCGSHFQNEVGKFRFLNEMIKLVSPKYLGSETPLTVKQKVLQLLYVWTLDYPKETKIKEAFDMLRKQGVIREIPNPNMPSFDTLNVAKRKPTSSVFQDEEKSKILQKLLQSKDPEDVQAANWLIKSMVKEDDKRAEMKSRRISELESVQNNVRLLNEMLDSYKPGISSAGELDLIKELYQNCERLRPTINKLILETNHGEGILGDVLGTNDELSTAFNKYNILIVQGKPLPPKPKDSSHNSLLNFEVDAKVMDYLPKEQTSKDSGTSIDVLCDIFNNAGIPDSGEVLQPVALSKYDQKVCDDEKEKQNKFRSLEDLDILGEHLIKENLQGARQTNFRGPQEKIPMNRLGKISETKQGQSSQSNSCDSYSLDLNYLLQSRNDSADPSTDDSKSLHDTSDDFLVDISDEKMLDVEKTDMPLPEKEHQKPVANETDPKKDIKLNDIHVKLEDIEPSSYPPVKVLDERNGISVSLHLAKDKPREGVNVFVVTTVSKNKLPLSSFMFQAVVPKGCKLKMQPPSSTDLPAYNPFLPPSAITQIMLVANPGGVQMSLKFFVSYTMDEDTVTEMGEVEDLPAL